MYTSACLSVSIDISLSVCGNVFGKRQNQNMDELSIWGVLKSSRPHQEENDIKPWKSPRYSTSSTVMICQE